MAVALAVTTDVVNGLSPSSSAGVRSTGRNRSPWLLVPAAMLVPPVPVDGTSSTASTTSTTTTPIAIHCRPRTVSTNRGAGADGFRQGDAAGRRAGGCVGHVSALTVIRTGSVGRSSVTVTLSPFAAELLVMLPPSNLQSVTVAKPPPGLSARTMSA